MKNSIEYKQSCLMTLVLRKSLIIIGMFTSMMAFPSSLFGQCNDHGLEFSGNGYGLVAISDIRSVSNTFTMELWVKPNKFESLKSGMTETTSGFTGISGQNYAIYPMWASLDQTKVGAGISVGTNGIAILEHANNYMPAVLVKYMTISTTDWTHITLVYINKKPHLYVNGVFIKSGLTSTKDTVFPSAELGGGFYGPFRGSIDEVRVWADSMNGATITDWYNKYKLTSHPKVSKLYLQWKLDEGSGKYAYDGSGNNHVGTLIDSVKWIKPGAFGYSLSAPEINSIYPDGTQLNNGTIYYGAPGLDCAVLSKMNYLNGEVVDWYQGSTQLTELTDSSVKVCPATSTTYTMHWTYKGCSATVDVNITVEDVTCGNGKEHKVKICHNGKEICVDTNALQAHLNHGDDIGGCSRPGEIEDHVHDYYSKDEHSRNDHVEITAFPNPVDDRLNIILDSDRRESIKVQIYNNTGQLVAEIFNGDIESGEREVLKFDFAGFCKGMYFLKIQNGESFSLQKIMVN